VYIIQIIIFSFIFQHKGYLKEITVVQLNDQIETLVFEKKHVKIVTDYTSFVSIFFFILNLFKITYITYKI